MFLVPHRTKIVATIGPASRSPETIRHLINAGMGVARLNFSHGSYDDHAVTIQTLRQVSQDLDYPLVLLQDLQGPKIRVVQLTADLTLTTGETITLGNAADGVTIPIDYPSLAEEAIAGNRVLLDDGKLELKVLSVQDAIVTAEVVRGGTLKNRKGVNFPELALRLPSITDKDKQDLAFGLENGIDWVALSFVRQTDDVQALKTLLTEQGASDVPVIAKIERPQAIDHLDELVHICDGIMVARGDLGVEMSPEKVPMLQKQIIHACNQQGIPVITATQMLESMITNAQPTRAEASDVANAIIDGTDAVMLSGESAVGDYPIEAVKMLGQIATEVEPMIEFINLPPAEHTATHALSEALNVVDKILDLRWIVAFTSTGYTAKLVAAERPKAPILALTTEPKVYTRLNVIWGVTPILIERPVDSVEVLAHRIEEVLQRYELAEPGDQILILGGSPVQMTQGTNFLKIHTVEGP
jgi:pyruvate kinase